MMVQLQNADRLNQVIKFGTVKKSMDENGFPTYDFQQLGGSTLCGNWSLNTSQMIQVNNGSSSTPIKLVVCHHRRSWSGITHAEFNNQLYMISGINQDPYRNPTAYDQITLTKVDDQNG